MLQGSVGREALLLEYSHVGDHVVRTCDLLVVSMQPSSFASVVAAMKNMASPEETRQHRHSLDSVNTVQLPTSRRPVCTRVVHVHVFAA